MAMKPSDANASMKAGAEQRGKSVMKLAATKPPAAAARVRKRMRKVLSMMLIV